MFNDKSNDTACGAHRYRCRRWAIIYSLHDNSTICIGKHENTHTRAQRTHTRRGRTVYTARWKPIMKQLTTEQVGSCDGRTVKLIACMFVFSTKFSDQFFTLVLCHSNLNVLLFSCLSSVVYQLWSKKNRVFSIFCNILLGMNFKILKILWMNQWKNLHSLRLLLTNNFCFSDATTIICTFISSQNFQSSTKSATALDSFDSFPWICLFRSAIRRPSSSDLAWSSRVRFLAGSATLSSNFKKFSRAQFR